jgi:hypothetical protein
MGVIRNYRFNAREKAKIVRNVYGNKTLKTIQSFQGNNVTVEWSALLLPIWEVSGSNLRLYSAILIEISRGFSQFFQSNTEILH